MTYKGAAALAMAGPAPESGSEDAVPRSQGRSRLHPRPVYRTARCALWLTLLFGPLALPAEPGVYAQLPPGFGQDPPAEPDDEEGPDEAPGEEADAEDTHGRRPAVAADEPAEVTAGRLAALPVAGHARLMAVQAGLEERRAAGSSGIVVGTIHSEIELGIAYYTERVVREAEAANALLLIWEIETPGGRVDAAVMMRDYMLESEVPSVAFVNRRAWSAGALISLGNDLIIGAEGSSIGAATPVTISGGGMQPVEEKVVSALRGEFRASAEATGRPADVAEAMVDADLAVGGIIESGRLLTLTGREAIAAGIAEARVEDREELLALLGVSGEPVTEIEESWAESLVRLLTSSTVSGLLMTLGLLGILFELMTPGFGWAGGLGVGALVLFFAGHLLVNLAGSEEILLFLLGLGLLGVEIFLIPGFGITGVSGLLCIGAALTLALINLDIDVNLSPIGVRGALLRVMVSLLATVVGGYLLFKLVPRTSVGRRLVLSHVVAAGPNLNQAADELVRAGDTGVAVTDLYPYGAAKLAGRRVEVVADGGYIDKGTTVRVLRVTGSRIEVRAEANDSEGDQA